MMEHINGYSLALFSLAKEDKKLKEYKKQSMKIIESLASYKDYIKFMDMHDININLKKELVKKAFKKELNHNLFNFLLVIIDRKKFKIVNLVLIKLIKLINKEINISEGVIYTSKKLNAKELKDMKKRIEKTLNLNISLENKIDNEIISGFKVQVEDSIIEDTVSSRLEYIKNKLLRKEN